jgi:hypothetical protein
LGDCKPCVVGSPTLSNDVLGNVPKRVRADRTQADTQDRFGGSVPVWLEHSRDSQSYQPAGENPACIQKQSGGGCREATLLDPVTSLSCAASGIRRKETPTICRGQSGTAQNAGTEERERYEGNRTSRKEARNVKTAPPGQSPLRLRGYA